MNMKPCKDPSICGVQNHRPGTGCRAEGLKKGTRGRAAAVLSSRPPSSSKADPSGVTESEYGSLAVKEPNGNWGSTTYSMDSDAYAALPKIDPDNKAVAESIRHFSEFRVTDAPKWRGVHAAWTGEDGDVYTVLKGDRVIAFRDANGDFVMHNTAAGISYGQDHALVHAASRMDLDGNITPDGTPREFPVNEVAKESDFNKNLKRHLGGEAQDDMPSITDLGVAFREGKVTQEGLTAAARQVLTAPKGKSVQIHSANAAEVGVTSIKREPDGRYTLTLHRMGREIHLDTNDDLMYLVRRAATH